jgi:hypothetical protein
LGESLFNGEGRLTLRILVLALCDVGRSMRNIKPPAAFFSSLKEAIYICRVRIRAGRIAGRKAHVSAGDLKVGILAQACGYFARSGRYYVLLSGEQAWISYARHVEGLL